MLVVIFAVVILDVHIIVIRWLGFGLREVLPLLVEEALQLDTRKIYGRARGVEMEAVADHELEVGEKCLGARVLVGVQPLPHGREVHGLLDHLRIGRDVQRNPVYERELLEKVPVKKIKPDVPTGS